MVPFDGNMTRMTSLRLDAFLPFQLSVTSNAISRLIARSYEHLFGLRVPEWRLVAVLAEQPGLTQQEIVARTEMDKMTVSRAAQTLVERQLASRVPHGNDKRSHRLSLTSEGERLYAQVAPAALAMEQQIVAELSPEELAALKAMLAKLKSAAERHCTE